MTRRERLRVSLCFAMMLFLVFGLLKLEYWFVVAAAAIAFVVLGLSVPDALAWQLRAHRSLRDFLADPDHWIGFTDDPAETEHWCFWLEVGTRRTLFVGSERPHWGWHRHPPRGAR